jgi:hypothetical protein
LQNHFAGRLACLQSSKLYSNSYAPIVIESLRVSQLSRASIRSLKMRKVSKVKVQQSVMQYFNSLQCMANFLPAFLDSPPKQHLHADASKWLCP